MEYDLFPFNRESFSTNDRGMKVLLVTVDGQYGGRDRNAINSYGHLCVRLQSIYPSKYCRRADVAAAVMTASAEERARNKPGSVVRRPLWLFLSHRYFMGLLLRIMYSGGTEEGMVSVAPVV